jgi:hypothetical protein
MVAAYTRFIVAMMSPLRVTGDLLAGMWQLLQGIGAVPRTIMWDNESGIGQLTEGMVGFCGVLAARIIQTDPLSPKLGTGGTRQRLSGDLGPAGSGLRFNGGY